MTQLSILHHAHTVLTQYIITTTCILCKTEGHHSPPNICQYCLEDIELYTHPKITLLQDLQVITLAPYVEPFATLISQLKYQANINTLPIIQHILRSYTLDLQDLHAVPIPMHWRRKIWRGIDHTGILAQQIAKQYRIPISYDVLKRTLHRPTQESLNKKQRLQNAKNSFCGSYEKHQDLSILLIDDVLTTGSTLLAAYKTLKHAKTVCALTLAKA